MGKVIRLAVTQVGRREDGERALREALAVAGQDEVPMSAGHLTAFVLGPLFDAVIDQLGVDAAERMVCLLKPVLQKKSELELGTATPEPTKPTVLIVDEDIVVRAQLLSILNASGYNAVSAPDQNVALAMSVRCRPDIIISDMSMGRVKGSQLAALLKVAFDEAAPPIIILNDEHTCRDLDGGICMLKKPIDRNALLDIINPLLARCSQPPSGISLRV
jgi:CheY-like chemotaxis protein